MLDIKHEENLRSWENRMAAEAAYDAWKDEAPMWGLNQAITCKEVRLDLQVPPELRKEVERLRKIREKIRNISH